MADKEERICICKLEGNATDSVCGGSMTRQEAIEVMAKAIRSWEFPYSPRQIGWEDLSEDTKDDYKNMAEAALNALLEGGK